MNSTLFTNFIKDRINIIGVFMLNSSLLILFFNLEQGTRKEVMYPIVLSGFLLILLLISEWIKYYSFHRSLQNVQENIHHNLHPVTAEQKLITNIKTSAVQRQASVVNQIIAKHRNQRYFLSQWIHNLKTPISVVDLIIQKCSLEKSDPYQALDNIKQENKRLHDSIEQVLTLIRLEDFEKDYEPEPVDLVSSIKKLLHSRKRQFIASDVFPELSHEAEEMKVLSDSKWNELMLDQVISNAMKYSKEPGNTKKLYINITYKEGHTVLSIKDEGIGIPAYDLNRVFEPFFTGDNGRKYRDSTGIGLYMCKEIARKLDHEISITSKLQEGTEVIVTYITKL
ncbi:sensor histidine kinase [Bacillus sp. HMF5848]|uniref:sensor histidine kinase n=1 Tax=Bacillus sp. HMF5848 TaxID=2495421 RepID=UPI000F791E88|nr:sensor histidine kinase [Bacillus sp. HMF5848]RSK26102.1 sensor histidine kinase [Bacillus sp. HMF5848]